MAPEDSTDPATGLSIREKETLVRHARHRAKMAYVLIWVCSTVGMFFATAFMLYFSRVDAKNLIFYMPLFAFAVIMAIAVPLTAKITKFYHLD
jgi:Na+/melibiose symporter-like transporter